MRTSFTAACFAILLLAADVALGQATWNGGANPDFNWSGANWLGTAPVSGGTSALTFMGSVGTSNTNTFSSFTASSITFGTSASSASAFTLSGSAITLAGNITNNSNSFQTLNMPITLRGQTQILGIQANTTDRVVINGRVSGTGGFYI